jgi:hypothetical protein
MFRWIRIPVSGAATFTPHFEGIVVVAELSLSTAAFGSCPLLVQFCNHNFCSSFPKGTIEVKLLSQRLRHEGIKTAKETQYPNQRDLAVALLMEH